MAFWTGKKILLTGRAGFLGSFLVEQLKEKGESKVLVTGKARKKFLNRWWRID